MSQEDFLTDSPDVELPQPTTAMAAFDVLADYEKRSLEHVAGLPEQLDAPGLWRGIGFRLGDFYLVSSISEVNEILRVPTVTPVPGTKAWMLGIANVRGNLIPLVHLRGLLEGERYKASERARVLAIKQSTGSVGLVVDEVLGQRSFVDENKRELSTFLDSPISTLLLHEYAQGALHWGVFSMSALIKEPEFLQAAA
jgi:twitching motility protein PilI